jgi:hypothetical protein
VSDIGEGSARADRVENGWIGSPESLPRFRPSGVPECCDAPMTCRTSRTSWDGSVELHRVDWKCGGCARQLVVTFG